MHPSPRFLSGARVPDPNAFPVAMRPLLAATFLLVLALLGAASATGATAGEQPAPQAHSSAPAVPLAARSACFGAAARDPRGPCRDGRLTDFVYPRPALAATIPNSPCELVERQADMNVCSFGAAPEDATETIALVGDSHASHWRAALDVVAQERGWRGLSMAHTSCPLSKAVRDLEGAARFKACADWKTAVFAWFQQHPEIHTVFVAGLSGGSGVFPSGGRGRFATSVSGYKRAWDALPSTVTRIVVIRDTPKMDNGDGRLRQPRPLPQPPARARPARCRAARCSTATRSSSPPRGCPRAASAASTSPASSATATATR